MGESLYDSAETRKALVEALGRVSDKTPEEELLRLFHACVSDLIQHRTVLRMENFTQHGGVTCLDHCLFVSYKSFLLCRRLGLDYRSAARGGLLHDLFLYDWHEKDASRRLHAFRHPGIALKNAAGCFALSNRERDIIRKHMWPLTVIFPRYPETLIVSMFDKYCAVAEFLRMRLHPLHDRAA